VSTEPESGTEFWEETFPEMKSSASVKRIDIYRSFSDNIDYKVNFLILFLDEPSDYNYLLHKAICFIHSNRVPKESASIVSI
jgi:hypothetical protein